MLNVTARLKDFIPLFKFKIARQKGLAPVLKQELGSGCSDVNADNPRDSPGK
jgi:hypothetical protein